MKTNIHMITIIMQIITIIKKIALFYTDGFRKMKVGKSLWLIIGIKFILFFVIMKLLFFPDILKENFTNDSQRATFILNNLTQEGKK